MSQEDFSFKIQESVREAVPPLISLWSKSGGGKTYSALLLARGMVGPSGKIVVIDTENGRSKFYSDVSAPWFHLDLQPPFTPDKYKAAFEFSEKWGADVIIVDSGSHVWEGEGGVIDMADRNGGSGLQKWNAPKMAHKRMMNNLTASYWPSFSGSCVEKRITYFSRPKTWKYFRYISFTARNSSANCSSVQ